MSYVNEHRDDSTQVLRFNLQRDGELVLSGIGPDRAPKELKRVKRIVSQVPGLRKKLDVTYDAEARTIYAIGQGRLG